MSILVLALLGILAVLLVIAWATADGWFEFGIVVVLVVVVVSVVQYFGIFDFTILLSL